MMTRLLASLILLFATAHAAAQTWYQVNLVVFENRGGANSGESWQSPQEHPAEFPPGMLSLDEDGDAESASGDSLRNLTVTDKQFAGAVASLQRGSQYKVLAVKSWRQPGHDRNNAVPVRIRGGDTYGDRSRLDGTVKLVMSRYLHLETDLWLGEYTQLAGQDQWWEEEQASTSGGYGEAPVASTAPRYEATRLIRMQEARRMRSGELHYIDHPVIGVMVKVTPLKAAEPAAGQ